MPNDALVALAQAKLAEAIAFEETHPVAETADGSRRADLVRRRVDRLLDEAVELEARACNHEEQVSRVA